MDEAGVRLRVLQHDGAGSGSCASACDDIHSRRHHADAGYARERQPGRRVDYECGHFRGTHHDAGPLMKAGLLILLILAAIAPGQNTQRFSGTLTDSMCPAADHSQMRMGATSAECAIACANSHGAEYVLYDGKATYNLSDQKTSEK